MMGNGEHRKLDGRRTDSGGHHKKLHNNCAVRGLVDQACPVDHMYYCIVLYKETLELVI